MPEITRILAALYATVGQPAVLATLVQAEGSTYRKAGARLLLLPDGRRIGSISGGCLDEDVVERARRVLSTDRSELAVYDTTEENDLVWGVGLGCQGIVQIFLERIPPERPDWVNVLLSNQRDRRDTALEVAFAGADGLGTRLFVGSPSHGSFREIIPAPPALVICGAGDDVQPLVRMASEAGWQVTVVDMRAAYATPDRFPDAERLLVGKVEDNLGKLVLDAQTFVVVMTHRFEDDLAFMRALLPRDFKYLGQLGPRRRTERLLAQLEADGAVTGATDLTRLHSPVGLDLGGSTPEAVAVAILAELQARYFGRKPEHLRNLAGPIHA